MATTTITATQMAHLWMALENVLQSVLGFSQGSVSQDVTAFMLALHWLSKGLFFFVLFFLWVFFGHFTITSDMLCEFVNLLQIHRWWHSTYATVEETS